MVYNKDNEVTFNIVIDQVGFGDSNFIGYSTGDWLTWQRSNILSWAFPIASFPSLEFPVIRYQSGISLSVSRSGDVTRVSFSGFFCFVVLNVQFCVYGWKISDRSTLLHV